MATKPKGKFRSVRKKSNENATNVNKIQSTNTSISEQSKPSNVPSTSRDYLRINNNNSNNTNNSGHHNHKRNPSQSVMVRLKRLDTLRLNQRIKVKDYGYGSIQFLGCVHFAQGLFVGVELDEPKGKHDGSYHGKRYFTAKDKHGVLVKQHRVELLDVDIATPLITATTDNNLEDHDNDNNETQNEQDNDNDDNHNQHKNKSSIHFDELLFENDELYKNQLNEINELKVRNESLNDKMEQYLKTVDDLEIKIANLETENLELKQEKLHFENEMNTKIEELEDQLEQIRIQLTTKDEVLKKQISNHENTKIKFRKKIKEHEELKQKNQDIVQLILYGDKSKDDIIFELKKKEKKYQQEKQEYMVEMEEVQRQTQEKLNKNIEQWLFDYGDITDQS